MRPIALPALFLSAALLAAGSLAEDPALPLRKVALLIVQDRAGDSRVARAVERHIQRDFATRAQLADPEQVRDLLRRGRIRNSDAAPDGTLRELARELDVDWLVSVTVHDAERRMSPRLALSARIYDGATGLPSWVGFASASGLDGKTALGIGELTELESLIPGVIERLEAEPKVVPPTEVPLGRLAIVPFAGITEQRGTANAETVTAAARAELYRQGVDLVPGNCTRQVLRELGLTGWGMVETVSRTALRHACAADVILTGTVELYEVGGAQFEPEPKVALGLRLLDAETGRILWSDSMERRGWDRSGLFRAGRIHSRGKLTEAMMRKLIRRVLREFARRAAVEEETP